MNSRLLVKGLLGCLLFLIGTALCAGAPPKPQPVPASDTGMDTETDTDTAPDPAAPADTANPYSVIVERNIFHLNPPPPPPEPEKPKVELPEIKITGFVNNGDQKKVLFRSAPKDKKEGPYYYSLAEGDDGADGIHKLKLVKIHPSQDGVDVINDGVAVTLTLKDDTLGASGPPATAAAAAEGKEKPMRGGQGPGNIMPGRQMNRPGVPMPDAPGAGQNGFGFPTRARKNLPQPPGVPQ